MAAELFEIEGTWEDILARADELRGKRLRVSVLDEVEEGHPDDPARRRSTGADLLKHAVGWAGDDFEECLQAVYDSRSKAKF